jgi:hypothetical protein
MNRREHIHIQMRTDVLATCVARAAVSCPVQPTVYTGKRIARFYGAF